MELVVDILIKYCSDHQGQGSKAHIVHRDIVVIVDCLATEARVDGKEQLRNGEHPACA